MMTNTMKKAVSFLTATAAAIGMAATTFTSAFAANDVCDEELRSLANQVAILVNEARAEAGLQPIYVVPYLNEISDIRAAESMQDFSHTRAGQRFSSIIDTSIVDYVYVSENLAAGYDTAEDTMDQWKDSPKHWANIMNPDITHMGIGVAYDEDSDYGWYWQQFFVETNQEFANQYLPTDYEVVPKAEGDINGDGVIDSFDYLGLCEYIYKKKNNIPVFLNEAQLQTADCFRDGIITEADAKVMVRFLLGEYKSLPFTF